jgi:FkbM family methyltransferase
VLSGRVHEPETIEFMTANCGDRDIVHAGAFFGDFLPALSAALAPDALLWAFEPNRESYRCACITLAINDVTNVRLTHAGLGGRNRGLFITTADARGRPLGGASRIVRTLPRHRPAEEVRVVPVDEVVGEDRDIGILQLDVEGFEKQALSGALGTIRRCRPTLIFEVLPNSKLERSEWFEHEILSLGYRFVTKLHHNSVYSH